MTAVWVQLDSIKTSRVSLPHGMIAQLMILGSEEASRPSPGREHGVERPFRLRGQVKSNSRWKLTLPGEPGEVGVYCKPWKVEYHMPSRVDT